MRRCRHRGAAGAEVQPVGRIADAWRGFAADPRHYQLAVLGALLAYGVAALDFEVRAFHAAAILVAALLTQGLATRAAGLPRFEWRSALISAMSLALLLRTDAWWLAALGAAVAIASKFVVRVRDRHVFNPTNLGLVVMMAATERVWVSSGQWGTTALLAFALACLGGLVAQRAARADVTLAFLGGYAAILLARAAWLGDPVAVPLHQLQYGALLVFAFFMISDPKTTPRSRTGRMVFAGAVALTAAYIRFGHYQPNAPIWALAPCALLVPLLDRLAPGRAYAWRDAPAPDASSSFSAAGRGMARARPSSKVPDIYP